MLPRVGLSLFFVLLLVPGVAGAQQAPRGVPDGAEEATISGHVDGDKLKVTSNGKEEELLLAGIDAPEKGECFFKESQAYVKKLTPTDSTVYLERSGDDRDGKDRLLRYVWLPGKDGKKATLLNTKLVREGYAGFDDSKDNPKYFGRLEELQKEAKTKKAGLWKVCRELHVPPPKPTPKPTVAPATFSVVSSEDASFGGRQRWVYRIVVPQAESLSDEQVLATVVAAMRQAFAEHPGAVTVTIFAYRPNTDPNGVASLARGEVAVDGKGWNGEGNLDVTEPDNGNALIYLIEWDPTYGIVSDQTRHEVPFNR